MSRSQRQHKSETENSGKDSYRVQFELFIITRIEIIVTIMFFVNLAFIIWRRDSETFIPFWVTRRFSRHRNVRNNYHSYVVVVVSVFRNWL